MFQPVVKMDPAQIVKILCRQLDFLFGDAIHIKKWLRAFFQGTVKCRAIHGAIQVRQPFRALADQVADLRPPLQRQLEALEALGAVDGVKHPRPAKLLIATARLHKFVNGNQVGQVGLAGMSDLVDSLSDEEVGKAFPVFIHG